ncbi:MAG: hypothetical protein AABX59_03785, partial [Nanoarchaeota archaeon]
KISYFYKLQGKLISKQVIFIEVETKSKEVRLSFEHVDFRWLSYGETLRALNFKNQKDLFKKADQFVKEHLKQKRLV